MAHQLPETGYLRLRQILGDPRADPPVPALIPIGKTSWWAGVAQQTNIANGPQQVNNGPPNPGDAKDAHGHTGKYESEQNELLEVSNGDRLDAGTAGATGRSNPEMVPVGSLDRSADG
jgi:hypothetical protein